MINCFPGYEFAMGDDGKMHNMYRGTDVGFGGYVYAEPGMYENVALLDVASMHPTSIINLNKLGKYTQRYADLREARVLIKHGDYDAAGELFDGKLKKYLGNKEEADSLSKALKLPLNSFFGISFTQYNTRARDLRDKNNIIALRGALFMRTLQDEVQNRGFTVAHIKTDSIKIPNATPEIIKFVMDFGKEYGYDFEHEATYEKMCLVNDAVYIAKYSKEFGGKWTATGAQFAVPYVFKMLFSKEPIEFKDLCETKSVTKGEMYLDFNEGLNDDEHDYHYVGKVGMFCPIVQGAGGGVLYRKADNKFYAVTGTKGYRWLESEMVEKLAKQEQIDRSYYDRLVDEAIDTINKYGDYQIFASEEKPEPLPFEGGKIVNLPIAG